MHRTFAKIAIVATAVLETAFLGLFAAFALSGDDLGIARDMLTALAVPYGLMTLPGMVLLMRGYLLLAAVLVELSVPLIWVVWFFA